jgi:hypothetical protein
MIAVSPLHVLVRYANIYGSPAQELNKGREFSIVDNASGSGFDGFPHSFLCSWPQWFGHFTAEIKHLLGEPMRIESLDLTDITGEDTLSLIGGSEMAVKDQHVAVLRFHAA